MTLTAFLSSLQTQKISVTLADTSGELITFNSDGYGSVESDLLARNVQEWAITGSKAITITLSAA